MDGWVGVGVGGRTHPLPSNKNQLINTANCSKITISYGVFVLLTNNKIFCHRINIVLSLSKSKLEVGQVYLDWKNPSLKKSFRSSIICNRVLLIVC